MDTIVLPASEEDAILKGLNLLARGGILSFPTDTVYGLAADCANEDAIQSLFAAKGRDFNKAIAVLIGGMDQAFQLTDNLPSSAQILMHRFWPGGLTVIVNKKGGLPVSLSPTSTIGIRMPDHPVALEILRRFGPLATTSANLSGGKNPQTASDVLEQLEGKIPLLLDGGACKGGVPSTVVDCTGETVRILRYGAIMEHEINNALEKGKS